MARVSCGSSVTRGVFDRASRRFGAVPGKGLPHTKRAFRVSGGGIGGVLAEPVESGPPVARRTAWRRSDPVRRPRRHAPCRHPEYRRICAGLTAVEGPPRLHLDLGQRQGADPPRRLFVPGVSAGHAEQREHLGFDGAVINVRVRPRLHRPLPDPAGHSRRLSTFLLVCHRSDTLSSSAPGTPIPESRR